MSGPYLLVTETFCKEPAPALPPGFSEPREGNKLFLPHPGHQLSSLVTRITFSEATLLPVRTTIYLYKRVKTFSSTINFWL